MTREEIMGMNKGRKLDAFVAKYVMFPRHTHPIGEIQGWCQYYSSLISSAMEVESKIKKMEWHIQHNYLIALHQITGVYGEMNLKDIFSMMQASPVDRCKAALLAVMEGKDERE